MRKILMKQSAAIVLHTDLFLWMTNIFWVVFIDWNTRKYKFLVKNQIFVGPFAL